MPKPSRLGTQIEETLARSTGYATHPAGHSEYLLDVNRRRIGTPDRRPKGTPPLYVSND
jgi:hypothetical protein